MALYSDIKSHESFTDAFLSSVEELSSGMLRMCEKMQALRTVGGLQSSALRPSMVRISTMTLFSKLRPPVGFDLSDIIDLYLTDGGTARIRAVLGIDVHITFPIRKTQKTSRGKSINNFFNQLTFWYKDRTKKSIKLFINGNIHVTGCRTLKEYVWLVDRLCRLLNHLFPPKSPQEACVADTIDIQMINTNFNIQTGLDLNKLKRRLLDDGRCATYDREVYPGLNLKLSTSFSREASILIFISGNIIITGVKHFLEVYEAYQYITGFVSRNIAAVSKARLLFPDREKKQAGPAAGSAATQHTHGYDPHFLHSVRVWDLGAAPPLGAGTTGKGENV